MRDGDERRVEEPLRLLPRIAAAQDAATQAQLWIATDNDVIAWEDLAAD